MACSTVSDLRRFYARLVTGRARSALRTAFIRVPRERFLGKGPWKIVSGGGYIETPSSDPTFIYQDVVVAISPGKHLNNGLPSLHAECLSALAPRPGESVIHIGGGTGYYSAILAELVGPTGLVNVFEIDSDLATAAKSNLADRPNVVIHSRSGIRRPLPCSDVIYVNAGATASPRVWLGALRPEGRLIFPSLQGRVAAGCYAS